MYKFRPLDEVSKALNEISPSFCAAKWYRSSLWLNSGQTASCHLPPAHDLDLEKVKADPRALHNTDKKIKARQQMLSGERPSECSACWNAEDAGGLSDRIIKSRTHSQEDYGLIAGAPANWSVNPTHLEISFGDKCNFACSYCNQEYSSRWQRDMKTPYVGITTEGNESYTKQTPARPDALPELMKAFNDWWPRLKNDMRVLRITGGEPLLSKDFWTFIERVAAEKVPFYVGVNTNLGAPKPLIKRLIEVGRHIKNFELYTSNDTTGPWAEYLRDGMDYQEWKENLIECRDSGSFSMITIMVTMGALSGFGLISLFKEMELIRYTNPKCYIDMSLNLIRFPEFQGFNALPPQLRIQLADEYLEFLSTTRAGKSLNEVERKTLERIVAQLMLTQEVTPARQQELARDLQNFVRQYDQRRKKFIMRDCPEALRSWVQHWSSEATSGYTPDKSQQAYHQPSPDHAEAKSLESMIDL